MFGQIPKFQDDRESKKIATTIFFVITQIADFVPGGPVAGSPSHPARGGTGAGTCRTDQDLLGGERDPG